VSRFAGRFAPVGSLRSRLLVCGYWFLVFANNHQPITNNPSIFARRSAATLDLSMDNEKEAA
jgi:hypothetical protein